MSDSSKFKTFTARLVLPTIEVYENKTQSVALQDF
jgi:hypothetical protein